MIDHKKLKKDFDHFQKLKISVVIDHGRAGNMFFMRLFDQHPEISVIARIGYFYSNLIHFYDGQNEVDGTQVIEWLINESGFRTLCLELSPEIEAECLHIGEDPIIDIDRKKVAEVLEKLLIGKVSKRKVLLATHLAYCYGRKHNTKQFKCILVNDSMTGVKDYAIFKALQSDFGNIKIIHLVRDPRANFASLRHQYVNAFATMYPVYPKRIFKSLPSNSVWLWVLFYTTYGVLQMHQFLEKLDKDDFYIVRIEDVNISFIETMKKLVGWLDICWYNSWSDPEYIVTSVGKPWRGISAYKSYYQKNTQGPLTNDAEIKNVFAKPDPTLPKKWKKHVFRREEIFLESIYYDEIEDYKYELQFIKSKRDKTLGLFWGLLPFSGEIPKIKWYFTIRNDKKLKDIIIKLTYLPVLTVSYFISRFHLFFLYFSGKLITRPKLTKL